MTKITTITSKGQITLPMKMRRIMGLDNEGATVHVGYDSATKRMYIEKAIDIESLHAMNRKIIQRQSTTDGKAAKQYRSGDGFRGYVAKKYGQ